MDFRWLLKLGLAVFVTVGLVAAPLVTPAAVAQPYMGGMMDMSMSADMPCCPDGQKSKDCQDCARRDVRPEDGSGRPLDNGGYAAAPSGPHGAFRSQ
jgi:hypothetical protein